MPDRNRVPAFLVFSAFLRLGLSSFGGPVAHLGYFRREFVGRRGWLSEGDYAELVALCQFLPGPASSQTGFAIGMRMAGIAGGIAAFIGFTLPSALLMLAAAYGFARLDGPVFAAVVHGLNIVAVAVVAHAVVMMARANIRSVVTALIAVIALGVAMQGYVLAAPLVIAVAALAGVLFPAAHGEPRAPVAPLGRPRLRLSIALFAITLGLLALLPFLRQWTSLPFVETADGFYRAGALVFGGGHVVLPLLEAETAARLSHTDFLAGYGAAQALPGPLFSFAAYAGALAAPAPPDPMLGIVALLSIFLPGLLLVAAAEPVWAQLRAHSRAPGLVAFASAAVVGVLAAAWWNPVASTALVSWTGIAIAAAGFLALLHPRTPVVLVVLAVTLLGALTAAQP